MDASPGLVDLPPEIYGQVLERLAPADLRALERTHSRLSPDDKTWRDLVHDVLREADPSLDRAAAVPVAHGSAGGPWAQQARFLLPRAQWLGYWASSRAHKSRIIRISAAYSPADASDAAAQTLTITASLLSAHNAFSDPTPPAIVLPTGCHLEPDGCAYESPRRGPGAHTPDRGLSVDVLAPSYIFSPLFTITASSGAVLASGRSRPHALQVALRPIDVVVPRPSPADEIERARRGLNDMYSLFTGRMPAYSWPTKWLLGPERAGTPRGALRGVRDWMRARGDEGAVVQQEEIEGELRSVCEGFHLEPRTSTPSGESAGPSTPMATTPGRNTPTPALENPGDDVPRRARVGPNGGPAMLWQANRDPQDRPGVALIRAGGDNGAQDFFFNVGEDNAIPGGLLDTIEQAMRPDPHFEQEQYLPIHSPTSPLAFDSPPTTDSVGDILASSLEGLWIGTYGPHGLEFGTLSIRCTLPSDPKLPYGAECPFPTTATTGLASATLTRPQALRTLEFTKVTGDVNVPAGQVSWIAELGPIDLSDYESSGALGTVPSVTNEELVRWSGYDPLATSAPEPPWARGTVDGAGHIAGSGFVTPTWIAAQLVFVRSAHRVGRETLARDGSGTVHESREIEVVDEIRLRWRELGKVSCFRRVRV